MVSNRAESSLKHYRGMPRDEKETLPLGTLSGAELFVKNLNITEK